MSANPRPLSITILSCIYIVTGAIGLAYHFRDLSAQNALQYDGLLIEFVRILAIVAGAFMLRGQNWARWLAIGWIALHVVLSAFHSPIELAIHALICAVIGWLLFRPAAARYFVRPNDFFEKQR